ncbi:hypothetical protein HZS80_07015 [Halomonas glaciei]|jgi:ADP-ribose pyrophosphatase YjhB (NUDIX family)|uniref:Uncharacterized protein n=1 Tax=Vreelandella glaciei TaxID=186761 RepID=A0A7Z0LS04_9GAMM|nr:hypothetical protein [Halomonas glaciei]NYS77470.1 hypothetical protein [Halomonas glaciei]
MNVTVLPKMTEKQHKAVVNKAVKNVEIVNYRTIPSENRARKFTDEEIQKAVKRFSKLILSASEKCPSK